jgi:hypothetical protein
MMIKLPYLTADCLHMSGYSPKARVQANITISMDPNRFTMQGEIMRNRVVEEWGQCDRTIAALYYDNPAVVRLCELWARWHFNFMRAGCEHQRASDRQYEISEPCEVCEYRYGSAWLHEDLPSEVLTEIHELAEVISGPRRQIKR